jgi:hypothetical protein
MAPPGNWVMVLLPLWILLILVCSLLFSVVTAVV